MKTATKTHSAVQLVREALDRAEQYADHHIFTELYREEALARAQEIDRQLASGDKVGRLAGVPYALKDNFLSPLGHTTASSKILEPFASPITATAVKKLEAEGAICIGRTNMDAFAHGSSTENSYFGPTKNSADLTRVAGGSSGGSAVAVALDIVQFATGTDTGGSIRQPASFNGVYGFKPTYGTISRYGVVAMASSTDCIGFFTRSAEDMDLLMRICAGQDAYDTTTLPDYYTSEFSTTVSQPDTTKTTAQSNDLDTPCTIGVIKDFDNDKIDSEIRQLLHDKITALENVGHKVISLEMPTLRYALAVYYVVVPAEIASNLSRYDGVRYGFHADDATSLPALYARSRDLGFMPENKRRIMIGNFVLSSGFYDAYYRKAQQVRTLIINEYQQAFSQCDFLLTPVSPSPAFRLGEKTHDPVAMYLEDILTVPVSLAGLPALSLPAGKTKSGLPLGIQLIGPQRSDASLLSFAQELA